MSYYGRFFTSPFIYNINKLKAIWNAPLVGHALSPRDENGNRTENKLLYDAFNFLIFFRFYIIRLKILFQGRKRKKLKQNQRKRKERLKGQSRWHCINTCAVMIHHLREILEGV